MSFLDALAPLVAWRLQSKEHRRAGVLEYLDKVSTDCASLTAWDGEPTDSSRLVQERLRAYYSFASSVLGDLLLPEDRDILFNAVASARVYYWIRALSGRSDKEIDRLLDLRGGPIGGGYASMSVIERVIRAYRQVQPDEEITFEEGVKELREYCIRDIAALGELRHRFAIGR